MRGAGIVAALLLAALPVGAADFHEIFEARCAGCHGHAGPFARERLRLGDGVVLRRDGRPVAPFLARHAGGLAPEEVALFLRVFARQIASGGLYRARCEICHDNARTLARLKLVMRDGRLVGRYTGRDIAEFLTWHGRLDADEAAMMTEALTEILKGGR